MALVACKECGKEVSKKAKVCPHCGFKPKRTSLFTWLVMIFVAVPIVIGIISTFIEKTPEQYAAERQRSSESQRKAYASVIAERAIKAQLKAPSTADFSGLFDTQVAHLKDGGPNKWIVKGYVDAQNSFGAKIRNNYQVVVEFEEGKDDNARVLSAELY